MEKSLEELKSQWEFNEDEVQCFIKLVKGIGKDIPTFQLYVQDDSDAIIGTRMIVETLVNQGVDPNVLFSEILECLKGKLNNESFKIININKK